MMKAVIYERYGSPDGMRLVEVEKPVPTDSQVQVKVHAVSINASDMEFLTARPFYIRSWGLFKPRHKILGTDIAGIAESVGSNVKDIKPGDAVFGDILMQWGGFAEYVSVPAEMLALKPDNMTFEHVSTLPQAGIVALQGLRDAGKIKRDDHVLIVGCGGGAGSFAVQYAKMIGAEVTGVDNGEKQDFMRSLGADHVIDYTLQNYTRLIGRYDLILDFVAPYSLLKNRRVLNQGGRYVLVGGATHRIIAAAGIGPVLSMFGSKKLGMLLYQQNSRADLAALIDLYNSGDVVPVIDKTFSLDQTPEAMRYLIGGHAKGKIVIKIV